MNVKPRVAAWILGALVAIGIGGSVYRIPMQVSDSLEVIERVVPLPSLGAAFTEGLRNSSLMLRPLKEVRAKLLVEIGEAFGNRFHLVFRGYHVMAGAVLIALFVWVCRVRTWTDVAALACALAILTGLHTFVGLFRESFPVNHFLVVAIGVVATFGLAQSRGGWLVDAAAIVIFSIAALTFESGLLVWPVAAAAYIAGARGISRRALIVMTLLLAAYVTFRMGYLNKQVVAYGQRTTGFGAGTLSPEEQVERFSHNPIPFWSYNISMAATSVLLSQPTIGQWTIVRAWQRGAMPPVFLIEVGSSLLTTMLIAWYIFGRTDTGQRRWREPAALVFLVVLVANAALSYAYSKNEIVSVAGVFYAVIAYVALRELLQRAPSSWRAIPIAALVLVLSSAWAVRAAGLHLSLRHGAFEARTGWAYVLNPADRDHWPAEPHARRVVARMREESILQPTITPALLPRWTELWWGED
jgi:hypothetical protein